MRRRVLPILIKIAVLGVIASVLVLPTLVPHRWAQAQGLSNGSYTVPYTACFGGVSANQSGTSGFTTTGLATIGVVQNQTSATGTNTHFFWCDITPPARFVNAVGARITDVTFYYGVQTTALGTQVAVLGSGTLNGFNVFTKIALPTAGVSETASTVAPARADVGTITITPVVASFNTGLTAAGAFFSVKFAPGTPISVADATRYYLQVSLLNTATSATITNSIGAVVHLQ